MKRNPTNPPTALYVVTKTKPKHEARVLQYPSVSFLKLKNMKILKKYWTSTKDIKASIICIFGLQTDKRRFSILKITYLR